MKTAFSGPLITYGDRNPPGTAATASVNPDKAPSVFWGGSALMDPRVGYNLTRAGTIGWLGAGRICVINQVPAALLTNNIATSQAVASAGSFVLTAGAGVTSMAAALVVWASGNTIPAGTFVLDGAPALTTFGLASISSGFTTVSLYNPATMLARNIVLTSNGGGDSGTVTLTGYDVYGYAMSEALTVAASTTTAGKKAFKFLTSATLSAGGVLASGALLGTGDVIGLPIRTDYVGMTELNVSSTWITASTGYLAADTTTATTTTGDVRGTYALQTPSNGTVRVVAHVAVVPTLVGLTTGLFGVAQA